MDDQTKANRTNQKNPTHEPSGPGKKAGYQGSTEKSTMDNKSNVANPNNEAYHGADAKKAESK